MILSYFGIAVGQEACAEKLASGTRGVTALSIVRAARAFGLSVRAYSLEAAKLETIPLPAILHWNFNHFVILERCEGSRFFTIADPSLGRRRLSAQEFGRHFTGVTLLFSVTPQAEVLAKKGRSPSRWRGYLRNVLRIPGMTRLLWQALVASLLLQAFGLVLPLLTRVAVDYVTPFQEYTVLRIMGEAMIFLIITQSVLSYLRATVLLRLQRQCDIHLTESLFRHLLSLPYAFFQKRSSGDILMRFNSSQVLRDAVTNQTIGVLLDGLFVVGYALLLFSQSALFGGVTFLLGLVEVGLVLLFQRPLQLRKREEVQAQSAAHSYLVEALRGILTLRASGAEEQAFTQWQHLFSRQIDTLWNSTAVSSASDALLGSLRLAAPLALLWIGTLSVINGTQEIGQMLAYIALALAFLTPIHSLVTSLQRMQILSLHLERIAGIIEAAPEQTQAQQTQLTEPADLALRGAIEFREVCFRYEGEGALVLDHVSLTIPAGAKVAVVGPTGSGKSTLLLLLLGLYTPNEGEVFLDGQPLASFPLTALRRQVGVVLQDPFLFSGSICSNILFNTSETSREHMIWAAESAGIADDIAAMPMGYETRIGEAGSTLSGGQRQRIAMARAIAKRPALLLLDEATSHLDTLTEQRVEGALNRLTCTRLVIAHRLSTIRDADVIYVMQHGRIAEQGSHAALIQQGGLYSTMVKNQSL